MGFQSFSERAALALILLRSAQRGTVRTQMGCGGSKEKEETTQEPPAASQPSEPSAAHTESPPPSERTSTRTPLSQRARTFRRQATEKLRHNALANALDGLFGGDGGRNSNADYMQRQRNQARNPHANYSAEAVNAKFEEKERIKNRKGGAKV